MTARKPLLDALVATLTPRDVVVSCLGANARYLPHMTVPCPCSPSATRWARPSRSGSASRFSAPIATWSRSRVTARC